MTQLSKSYVLSLALACAACGSEATPRSSELEGDASMAGLPCDTLNETRRCACGDAFGVQTCTSEGLSECLCFGGSGSGPDGGTWGGDGGLPGSGGEQPAGNLRTDIKFDWPRAKPSAGSCEPGRYEGTFSGNYLPQTLIILAFPVVDFPSPGLVLTLEQSGSGEILEISGGTLEGTANGLFPFRGEVTGALDCPTGKFNGVLDGYYEVGSTKYRFKGPLLGTYDKLTHLIKLGTWDVKEYDPKPVFLGGGTGTWEAGLVK